MYLTPFTFDGGTEVGKCTEDGIRYTLKTGNLNGEPLLVVISDKTNKSFIATWGDLIEMAKKAGINL